MLVRSQADRHQLPLSACTYHSLRSLHQKFEYSSLALQSKVLVCNIIELREKESPLGIVIVILSTCSVQTH